IEPDVEHLVAGLKAGIGLVMTHERSESAETCGDRQPGLRMLADLARQRQQLECKFELDVRGRRAFPNAGPLGLLALRIILLLAKLNIRAKAPGLHRDVEARLRVLAEHAVGACLAVGGKRTCVAAFGVVGTADKGAELAGLKIEPAVAAGRALPDI